MINTPREFLKYFSLSTTDFNWGITCTTVGFQDAPPQKEYPPRANHPVDYFFRSETGRVLKEYQLIYITEGSGYFESKSCERTKVNAGTLILLFPDEWHTYFPDKESGWKEYWVGFNGINIDRRIEIGFFSPEKPIFAVGLSDSIVRLYNNIIQIAKDDHLGSQQLMASVVLHILALAYYKRLNNIGKEHDIVDKLNKARIIMREGKYSIDQIVKELGIGEVWFRKMFKHYLGVSPSQYQIQIRITKSKEMLQFTGLTISEISYQMEFSSVSQFSSFFKKHAGETPNLFRLKNQLMG